MSRLNARAIGELVAGISVVLSLVFVGLQLQQSTIASRANAYQELGIAMGEGLRVRATDRELNDLLVRAGSSDPAVRAALTTSDIALVRVYALSILRIYQTAFLEVQEGLLRPEALEELGLSGFRQGDLLRNIWPDVRGSLLVEFAEYLESALELPPQ